MRRPGAGSPADRRSRAPAAAAPSARSPGCGNSRCDKASSSAAMLSRMSARRSVIASIRPAKTAALVSGAASAARSCAAKCGEGLQLLEPDRDQPLAGQHQADRRRSRLVAERAIDQRHAQIERAVLVAQPARALDLAQILDASARRGRSLFWTKGDFVGGGLQQVDPDGVGRYGSAGEVRPAVRRGRRGCDRGVNMRRSLAAAAISFPAV